METKIQRLNRWLCRLLGCESLQPLDGPYITRIGAREHFKYDGYDIELHFVKDPLIYMAVYLKGELVLSGNYHSKTEWTWTYTARVPSYRTRKYLHDYVMNCLTHLKDNT